MTKTITVFKGDGIGPEITDAVLKILDNIDCLDADDWSSAAYTDCVNAYIADKPGEQCILIVRRNRDIGKGTGTLLSPNDRILGNRFEDKIVLTVYKITGNKED